MSIILDGTNGISDVDGSASTPAIRGTDANTGIFFPAADTIAFGEGGSEAMRIDSSGNVGINTTSPASKLDISTGGSTGTTDMITLSGLDNGSAKQTYGVIQMGIENNTASSEQGNILLQTVESGTVRTRININGSGYMAFSNGGSERMRITSNGSLLVDTTDEGIGDKGVAINSQAYLGDAYGRINIKKTFSGNVTGVNFSHNNSTVGSISYSNTATAYNTSSDYRLKENIAPMTGALEKVAQLKPVTYSWKVDGSDGQGFIAHELAEVVPQAVTGEKDAVNEDGSIKPQGIDTSFLVATLTAAIQELNAKVETLEAQNAAFEARLAALEAK